MPAAKNPGFTLIEIMVAISIIAVMFGVVITSSSSIQKNTRDTQRQYDLRKVQSALQQYYADQNNYPQSLTFGGQIKSPTGKNLYLSTVPQDPMTGAAPYCYKTQSSFSNPAICDNATTPCLYYSLCANLETQNSSSSSCNCGGKNYNFQVNPP